MLADMVAAIVVAAANEALIMTFHLSCVVWLESTDRQICNTTR
jgi:hypothetical protein